MRKMILTNIFIALLLILVISLNQETPLTAAHAGNYYVSPEGSDSNPGTEDKPWKTIQRAADTAAPGSTITIKAGTYFERVNIRLSGASADKPTVFKAQQGDKVIIDGSESSPEEQEELVRISDCSFVQLIGLELTNNITDEDDFLLSGIGVWGEGEGIEIRDCRIHHIWHTGASNDSSAHGIAVYGRNGENPVSGLIINGNEIWDIKSGAGSAVALSGNVDGFMFTENHVRDIENIGIALLGDKKLGGEPVCIPEKNNRARNGFVGYNTVEGCSRKGKPGAGSAGYEFAGIKADGAKDVTIAYNICTGNDIGVAVENETPGKACSGITVRDNLIYGNHAGGIQAGSDNAGKGWSADCRFFNNTLYKNHGESKGKGEIIVGKSHDLLFYSNIIHTGPGNLAVSTENLGKENIYNISFNYNLYYGPGGARGLRFSGLDTGLVGLNMWKQKTGQDKNSRIADPRFSDADGTDFSLLQNSPAIDAGDPGYTPEAGMLDFAGKSRISGRAIDCGAYEF